MVDSGTINCEQKLLGEYNSFLDILNFELPLGHQNRKIWVTI